MFYRNTLLSAVAVAALGILPAGLASAQTTEGQAAAEPAAPAADQPAPAHKPGDCNGMGPYGHGMGMGQGMMQRPDWAMQRPERPQPPEWAMQRPERPQPPEWAMQRPERPQRPDWAMQRPERPQPPQWAMQPPPHRRPRPHKDRPHRVRPHRHRSNMRSAGSGPYPYPPAPYYGGYRPELRQQRLL
ncbi:MAG: hypothetical protein R3D85_00975 [Paracoccaceae bacterium]